MAQTEELPPAQPAYVLRGHHSQIHAISFYAGNTRVLTADAEGFILAWNTTTKRPVAGWKAHEKAVLGIAAWDNEAIISHGRDSRLVVWRLDPETEQLMHQLVPAERLQETTAKPAILQEMTVNTMNFCAFAWCEAPVDMLFADLSLENKGTSTSRAPILLAVPNTLDSESIDIFYMPAARRKSTIGAPKDTSPGMAMAIIMSAKTTFTVAAGYESGDVIVYQHDVATDSWKVVYKSRPHTQPVLSMCLHPDLRVCISSSADAIIAKHPFADTNILETSDNKPLRVVQTRHSGQQGLAMRNDGRIFSTAGWDSRIRVYSSKTMKELAVLKYHKQGCYETAFAAVKATSSTKQIASGANVTAVREETDDSNNTSSKPEEQSGSEVLVPATPEKKSTVMLRLEQKTQQTHWLAAGSKDGNVSLWDIY